jgi:hypothetical protein
MYIILYITVDEEMQTWLDEHAPGYMLDLSESLTQPTITFLDDAQAVQFRLTFGK